MSTPDDVAWQVSGLKRDSEVTSRSAMADVREIMGIFVLTYQ